MKAVSKAIDKGMKKSAAKSGLTTKHNDSVAVDPMNDDYSEYRVKDAADTIMKAHEHMADPKMMKMVKPHLDKKAKAVRSIADLRKRADEVGRLQDQEQN